MNRIGVASIVAAVLISFVPDVANAGYAYDLQGGTSCVKTGSGGTLTYTTAGFVYNSNATTAALINCPIPRTHYTSCAAPTNCGATATVYLWDGNDADSIDCRVYYLNLLDGSSVASTLRSTSSAGTGWTSLTLDGAHGTGYTYYTYSIYCLLPASDVGYSQYFGYSAYVH